MPLEWAIRKYEEIRANSQPRTLNNDLQQLSEELSPIFEAIRLKPSVYIGLWEYVNGIFALNHAKIANANGHSAKAIAFCNKQIGEPVESYLKRRENESDLREEIQHLEDRILTDKMSLVTRTLQSLNLNILEPQREELKQIGVQELKDSLLEFDPSYGISFQVYAFQRILKRLSK